MNTFWDKYYQKPLDEIPWQNTQADWFKELVDKKAIGGKSALNLGCGAGQKSIYLAQNAGFKKIIGVDISKQTIKYAEANAKNAAVENICTFINRDFNDWPFLKDAEAFDFILDWAAIHCIPPGKIKRYVKNITKHCKSDGKFLVRSFAHKNKNHFTEIIDGIKSKIYLRAEKELRALFPHFRLIARNKSLPSRSKSEAGYYFIELLMQKK